MFLAVPSLLMPPADTFLPQARFLFRSTSGDGEIGCTASAKEFRAASVCKPWYILNARQDTGKVKRRGRFGVNLPKTLSRIFQWAHRRAELPCAVPADSLLPGLEPGKSPAMMLMCLMLSFRRGTGQQRSGGPDVPAAPSRRMSCISPGVRPACRDATSCPMPRTCRDAPITEDDRLATHWAYLACDRLS